MSGPRQGSRWGSFLQQAVAGVESRLDTILAEEDSSAATPMSKAAAGAPASQLNPPSGTASARASGELSRQSSKGRKNDRLQERLSKAVGSRSGTPQPADSSVTSPAIPPASPRSSVESRPDATIFSVDQSLRAPSHHRPETAANGVAQSPVTLEPKPVIDDNASQPRLSLECRDKSDTVSIGGHSEAGEAGDTIQLLRSDYEAAELRRQEEMHEYVERIDGLQAKLKYLTQQAAISAKKAAEEADSGSLKEQLAKKEEMIALLIDEGQKLSQNELKLMTTIKALRARIVEKEKQVTESKQVAEKADKFKTALLDKIKTMESRQGEESQRAKRLEKDLERKKADAESKASKIAELQAQVLQAAASGASDRLAEVNASLEAERSTSSQLQEDLSTLKIEKKLADDRQKTHVQELEENLAREKERARVAELELRGEIAALEGRLETYRSQAEEISSSSGSDTQAKLFRQIETLQTQYSVASENWRGIESSLLARISTLEKDRNELGNKEADLRKKMREASTKSRRVEEDLEQAKSRSYELDEKLTQEVSVSNGLRSTLEKAQAEADAARAKAASAKEQISSLKKEIEMREAQALEASYQPTHAISPGLANFRSPLERGSTDRGAPYSRRHGLKDLERPSTGSRKVSVPIGFSPFSSRNDSQASVPLGSSKESLPSGTHSPYYPADQQEDLFDGVATPATPDKTINDMFSASTAAAGPSVQLVERMSAAVRRLEAEKAASKEEIDRIQSQRDEAREHVVSLMTEVDEKRKADERVTELEAEVGRLNQRYQTTLEMLGEKSEKVEELQADIEDMKQIYKDVLEKTMQ